MLLSPELIGAYQRAEYVVQDKFTLKIGRRSAPLDALLEAHGAASAAFVTAANPRGEKRADADNRAALAELEASLACPFYKGQGRDPDGNWPAEPSLLAVGITRGEAEALGRAWRQ